MSDNENDDAIDMTHYVTETSPAVSSAPKRIGLALGDEHEDWLYDFHDAQDVTWFSCDGADPVSVCVHYVRADLYESLAAQLASLEAERLSDAVKATIINGDLLECREQLAAAKSRLAEIEAQEPDGYDPLQTDVLGEIDELLQYVNPQGETRAVVEMARERICKLAGVIDMLMECRPVPPAAQTVAPAAAPLTITSPVTDVYAPSGDMWRELASQQPAAQGVDFGLPLAQEPKYTVNAQGRIINRATGVAIPDDEPVFILRAKDKVAADAIRQYAYLLPLSTTHTMVVVSRAHDFERFAYANPERMREPDTAQQEPRHD